jgi:hypothetical protein
MYVNAELQDINDVDKYCRENPLNHLSDAAASLVDELSKPK